MFINKFQTGIKRYFLTKQAFVSAFSCFLLFICGLLSTITHASAQQAQGTKERTYATIQQDPTRPPSVMVQQLSSKLDIAPKYKLSAIFSRQQNQYAVVNGNIVKAGDAVADMLVTEITTSNVTMEHVDNGTSTMVLELNKVSNVKKQVQK